MKLLPPSASDQLKELKKDYQYISHKLRRCRIWADNIEDEINDLEAEKDDLNDEVGDLEDQVAKLEMEVLEGPIRPEINTNFLDPMNNLNDEYKLNLAVNLAHNL